MSEKQIYIEEMVTLLKLQTNEYNELPDQEKLKNTDTYNKIIKGTDNCIIELETYKEILNAVDKPSKDVKKKTQVVDDKILDTSMNKIHEIKTNIDNPNMKLNDLIELYVQLTEIKSQLDFCFQNKKIEIIKL